MDEPRIRKISFLLPFQIVRYDEITIFLLSLTIMLFSLISAQFREFEVQILNFRSPLGWILAVIAISGIVLSIIHVLVPREKKGWEKYFMLGFAILSTIIVSGKAVMTIMDEAVNNPYQAHSLLLGFIDIKFVLLLFCVWNTYRCMASLFLVLISLGGIFENSYLDVTQSNSSLGEVMVASALLAAIILAGQFLIGVQWPVLIPIALTFTMSWQDFRRWLAKH